MFLDVDVVVTGSVRDMLTTDLSVNSLAAVAETSVDDNVERLNALGEQVSGYFNAGVLMLNLEVWREREFTKQFMAISDKYGSKLQWVDQDILNIHFSGHWSELNNRFNGIHIQEKRAEVPVIVHYNTFSKPWHYVDTHPYNYLYQKYLQLSPFKDQAYEGFTLKNAVLKYGRLFKRVLRSNNIIK